MAVSLTTYLTTLKNKILLLESKKMTKDLFKKIFCTVYEVQNFKCTAGSGWTIDNSSAYLIGNSMRIYVNASGGSTGAGNISDQKVCTITFNDPRIVDAAPDISGPNYTSGGPHSLCLVRTAMPPAASFDLYLTSTHAASSATSFLRVIPIELDITKF